MKVVTKITIEYLYAEPVEFGCIEGKLSKVDEARIRKLAESIAEEMDDPDDPEGDYDVVIRCEEIQVFSVDELLERRIEPNLFSSTLGVVMWNVDEELRDPGRLEQHGDFIILDSEGQVYVIGPSEKMNVLVEKTQASEDFHNGFASYAASEAIAEID